MSELVMRRATGVLWHRARILMQRLVLALTDSYRPERHYMRGPGPKCRAKDKRASTRGDPDRGQFESPPEATHAPIFAADHQD